MIYRLLRLLACCALVPCATEAIAQNARAAGPDDPVVLKNRILRTTTVSFQTPIFPIQITPTGFNPVDAPVTLNCPADTEGPCLFEADMSIQVGLATSVTTVQICTAIDGEFKNGRANLHRRHRRG